MIATDLHSHSFFSDGRHSPEDVMAKRAKMRLEVVALSDHDVFLGVERASLAAKQHGLTLIPAMEATSTIHFGTDRVEQVHVLAYFPPSFLASGKLWRTRLAERAKRVAVAWKEYALDFFARQSAEVRAAVGVDEIALLSSEEFPALQPLIDRITARCPDTYPHFQLDHVHFWEHELFQWKPEELIDVVRADGAIDVVAHPNRVRDKERMQVVLKYASGVEAYTSRHKAEVAQAFRAFAESRGKHWTASTDDHQHAPYVRPPVGTPRRTVDALLG
jgi:3',5'-nucleoside bisphosphate phosphatase